MAAIDYYCLKPDYFTGVSQGNGTFSSLVDDIWLNKNRATSVVQGTLTLFLSSLQVNRDSSHGSFMGYVCKGLPITVAHADYGNAVKFQCKEI